MNELSPIKARFLSRDAKEYAKSLVRKSTQALQASIKEQTGVAHMAVVDVGGGVLGWGADVGLRLATRKAGKEGAEGVRGFIHRNAAYVSGVASSALGTAGWVANAVTNEHAPLSWPRETIRTAAGTLAMFGLDRSLTKFFKLQVP